MGSSQNCVLLFSVKCAVSCIECCFSIILPQQTSKNKIRVNTPVSLAYQRQVLFLYKLTLKTYKNSCTVHIHKDACSHIHDTMLWYYAPDHNIHIYGTKGIPYSTLQNRFVSLPIFLTLLNNDSWEEFVFERTN